MTDAERVLNLLLHDVRTPLGVAHGYLRLIRDHRLTTDEDRERALAGTQQALGRISRLCEEAGAFLGEVPSTACVRAAASLLVERVVGRLRDRGIETTPPALALDDRMTLTVGTGVDRLADSIVTLLALASTPARPGAVSVIVDGGPPELRFAIGPDAGPIEPHQLPFDPWRGGYGLAAPLAWRTITGVGGRVWTTARAAGAMAIALPVEIAPE